MSRATAPRRAWLRHCGGALAASALLASCGGGGEAPADAEPASASGTRKTVQAAAPSQGRWGAAVQLDFVPAAAAQVANGSAPGAGRVVMWSAENRFSFSAQGETDPNIRTWTAVFDAATGTAGASTQDVTGHNMFCPGTANLADGRILVTGGSTSRVSSIYDPATRLWSRPPGTVINIPRAYQATVPLRDGSVFMLGGSWNGGVGNKGGEIWNASTGWRALSGLPAAPFETITGQQAGRADRDYHQWLLPAGNGRIFHAGPSSRMNWIDPRGNGSWVAAGTRGSDPDAVQGSIAMFEPGRILVTGGARVHDAGSDPNGVATANAHLVDITSGTPVVTRLPNMAFTRVFHNSVVLPNGQVMVIGGRDVSGPFNDTNARLAPELFDPASNSFVQLPALSVPRTYHSWALLLPDARVLVAGGGLCNCAADRPSYQIYTPHYLFNPDGTTAARPQMTGAPTQAAYGSELAISTDVAVASFVLVRKSSVTHTVNNDQRRIPLQIVSASGTSYRVAAPANPGWAMPGDYMLFAIDARGVPSLARTVRLGTFGAPLIEPVADQAAAAGSGVALQLAAAGGSGTTTYAATGLPPGLVVDANTGLVTGTPSAGGSYLVTAMADNGVARTATEFVWTVSGGGVTGGQQARFVRLESVSEVNGNVWASIAEFDVLGPTFAALPRSGWTASASSEETAAENGRASNAIDGSASTLWHSRWSANVPGHPHTFTVDLGSAQQVGGIRMLPRQDGSANGSIAQYRLYLSNDGVTWGSPVASGDFSTQGGPAATKEVRLAVNRAPTVTRPGAQSGAVGTAATLAVSAADADGDPLSFSATGLPPGLAIGAGSGIVSGVPTLAGSYNAEVTVSDGRGGSTSTGVFAWTITSTGPVAIPPIAIQPVNAGVTATYTVAAESGATYSWDFGDGSAPTAFSPTASASKVFAAPGVYGVTLTARSSAGALSSRSFLQAVGTPPTSTRPTASSAVALEIRTGASARLWVANPDHDTVAVIDTASNTRVAEIAVGASPRSVAIAPDGRVWVTNKGAATISILNPATLAVAATITLPRAAQPHGLVFAPGGSAFVVLEATGQLLKLDPVTGAVQGTLGVGANPRHVSASASGALVLVSRFITNPLPGEGTAAVDTTTAGAEVLAVNAGPMTLNRSIVLRHSDRIDNENQGAGIPNYLAAAVISPDGTRAWVPSKQDNVKRGVLRSGQALTFQNTVRAISSRIDMATLAEDLAARIDHDNASLGSGAAYHPSGAYLFVALETSRQVAVVDAYGGRELAKFDVGRAPQGLAVSADGTRLYAQNFMDRTVSVIDLGPLLTQGVLQFPALASPSSVGAERLAAQVLLGKQLFYDARDPRLARDSYMSCASCHADAGHDGRTWDFSQMGEGLRNTTALAGRAGLGHGFLHWSANFDEVQDFEAQIRMLAGGTGLMSDAQFNTGTRSQPLGDRKAGLSAELDALAAYLGSLNTFERSPLRNADGTLTAAAAAGRTVFANANCASCHAGSNFTQGGSALVNIGTIKPSSGQRLGAALTGIDVPTLRDAWKTAPYLHDGSAATLAAAVQAHAGNTVAGTDLANLVAYLQQIGSDEASAPTPGTGTGTGLSASYFANTTLAGSPLLTRTEVPWFDWGTGAPAGGVPADNFSVRWSGEVQAVEGGSYQFRTLSDDGVRVWVNGALVINNWTVHAPTVDTSGVVTLAAGQRVSIVVEFQEFGGGAVLQLSWLRPGGAWAQVPAAQLYPGAPPNQPPTVSLTAPASAVQGAAVTLSATAADADGTVARVEFYAGSTLLGSDTSAPYSIGWTPSAGGTYAVTARAVDNAGATTTSAAVNVNVSATTVPPSGAVACASEGGTCVIPTGAVASVWYGAGSSWFLRTGVSGSIACTNAVFGDPIPGTTKACRYLVTTPPPNQAPTVTLGAPTSATLGAAVSLTATAADADGTVARVEFYAGSTLLGSDTTAPYAWTWTPGAAGAYALTARAFDNAGAATTSATVTLTVAAAPVVTSSPLFGSTTAGTAFTDPVVAGQRLTGVTVRAGWWIDAIQGLATPQNLPLRGGTGGGVNNATWPAGEYLVRIYGSVGSSGLVGRIAFVTNTGRVLGPYGTAQGIGTVSSFDFTVPAGRQVLGFTGRASTTSIHAIGVLHGPLP